MNNADKPAAPSVPEYFEESPHTGLTKREAAAIEIMAGMLSNSTLQGGMDGIAKEISAWSVKLADALLEELSK